MATIETQTMTLGDFLATHPVCRVWWTSVGSPTGQELALATGDDVADEDYCDGQTLLDFIPGNTSHLQGEITRDTDGEWRWSVISLAGEGATDFSGNTILDLAVWGSE